MPPEFQGLGHQSHHVGLRYCLLLTNGKRVIVVSLTDECLFNKTVAGHFAHGLQDSLILNAAADELAFNHAISSSSKLHECPSD